MACCCTDNEDSTRRSSTRVALLTGKIVALSRKINLRRSTSGEIGDASVRAIAAHPPAPCHAQAHPHGRALFRIDYPTSTGYVDSITASATPLRRRGLHANLFVFLVRGSLASRHGTTSDSDCVCHRSSSNPHHNRRQRGDPCRRHFTAHIWHNRRPADFVFTLNMMRCTSARQRRPTYE